MYHRNLTEWHHSRQRITSAELSADQIGPRRRHASTSMKGGVLLFYFYLLVYLIGTMHIHEHCCIKIHHVNMPELVTITTFHPQSLGR